MDIGRISETAHGSVIRNLDITVSDLLKRMAAGESEAALISNHPGLEREDVLAVFSYAATVIDGSPWDRIRGEIKEKLGIVD